MLTAMLKHFHAEPIYMDPDETKPLLKMGRPIIPFFTLNSKSQRAGYLIAKISYFCQLDT